jgi:L-ectoine synthase
MEMKVVTIGSLEGTNRDVECPHGGFRSIRAVLAKDGMGFSMHKTIIPSGKKQHWHYKNHLEACYCIKGFGVLTNLRTKKIFEIRPDTIYMLDKHDDHTFTAYEDVVLISVFNPPLIGHELHREDFSYE